MLPERVIDGTGDRGARAIDPAFAGALEPEWIERARRVFRDQDLDRGRFARGGHEIIGERDGQGIAAVGIDEFLIQRAADSLQAAAGELTFDQHRIDGAAHLLGDNIALERDPAGLAIDPGERDVNAIGEGETIRVVPAFRSEPRLAVAEQLGAGREAARDVGERDRGADRSPARHHDAVNDVELARRGLQQLGRIGERLVPQLERRHVYGIARQHGRARGMGADAESSAIGLAMDHTNPAIVDAERLRANLRHDRFEALPDGGAASDQLDVAVGVDRGPRSIRWSASAFVEEDTQSNPDELAATTAASDVVLQHGPIDCRQGLGQ